MKYVIVISMGHDEKTPGKQDNGLYEWEFNRGVGHKLYNLLSPYFIVHFVVDGVVNPFDETTKEGRLANLKYRCRNANEIEEYYQGIYGEENVQVIFIAIHANAFDKDPDVSGYSIHITEKSSKRYDIAQAILESAKDILGVGTEIKERGIKESGFYVLKHTRMPAVLIEHEFFTNPEAAEKLKDDKFRQKCAEHITKGLLNYCGIKPEKSNKKNRFIITLLEIVINRLKSSKGSR